MWSLLPTCRGSTDQAASNSWILKTAVFKFGLRFLGAAYWYRLPPASKGLRFHSRCSHMPCPTYWHMSGAGGGVLSGQTQNARHTSCKPPSTRITTSSHPAKDYKGKETKLKVLEKEKILSGHSLCYYNCYVRQINWKKHWDIMPQRLAKSNPPPSFSGPVSLVISPCWTANCFLWFTSI